jgi:hypothetical protein
MDLIHETVSFYRLCQLAAPQGPDRTTLIAKTIPQSRLYSVNFSKYRAGAKKLCKRHTMHRDGEAAAGISEIA